MRRKVIAAVLAGVFALGAGASAAFAGQHGPPGPGDSHNGKCIGPPDDRIGGC
jgi:hypothetical protein